MKIQFEKYNTEWKQYFQEIQNELTNIIGFANPTIEHIGSTAVEGLSAKPIIDILVGLDSGDDLDKIIEPLLNTAYIYYEKYNDVMPYRRFFVKLKTSPNSLSLPTYIKRKDEIPAELNEHSCRLAHIHVLLYKSEHWIRHIAFRDYLRTHPNVKEEYQQLKENLSKREWKDRNEYNGAKDTFLKKEEQSAIKWYQENS